MKSVELGIAKDGKWFSSAVLVRNDEMQIRSKITDAIANKLKTFHEAVRVNGNITKLGDVILEKSVPLEGWREIFYRRSTADTQEAKRKAFERARRHLVEKGFLEVKDDLYIRSSMMLDRQDMTRTIDIMSGLYYRTDRTHPFRGVPLSGAK